MKTAFAAAMPAHAPVARRHPVVIDECAMRKKSGPGDNRARK
jgi:hypothetical protein